MLFKELYYWNFPIPLIRLCLWYQMSSRQPQQSTSIPLLQIKCLQKHLSFVHLAPIPEVPLKMPIGHTNLKVIDGLIGLIDFCANDSIIDTSSQTWPGLDWLGIFIQGNHKLYVWSSFKLLNINSNIYWLQDFTISILIIIYCSIAPFYQLSSYQNLDSLIHSLNSNHFP